MTEAAVTQVWMAGVMTMMLLLAAVAGIGYFRARRRERSRRDR